MKNLILLTLLGLISHYAIAEVVKPNEEILESDLGFKHEEVIAEDEDKNSDEGKRDVASDPEQQKIKSNSIQYWEY